MAFLVYDTEEKTIAIPIKITDQAFMIGRSMDNSLCLREDSMISRHHCAIYQDHDNGHFFLKDLNSSNGTVVNELVLHGEAHAISDMDQLTVGNMNFVFISLSEVPYEKNQSHIIQVNSPVPDISSPENSMMLDTVHFDAEPPQKTSILQMENSNFPDIDGYEIINEIGKSKCNYSTTYLAYNTSIKHSVVVKVFNASKLPPSVKDKFLNYVRIAAKLQHPNIISYINAGVSDNFCYLTMQYAEHYSLKNTLATEGRISENKAIKNIIKLAEAIQFANQKHSLHYNISLNNILLLKNGEPMLTDFGLAEWIAEAYQVNRKYFFGSTTNMSPEQMLDQPLNWTCDQYALGTIFYEMIVGKPCFDAPSIYALIEKHLREKVRFPSDISISTKTKDIIIQMMGKTPQDRFDSWHKLITALTLEPKKIKKKTALKPLGLKKDLKQKRKKSLRK
jgi:tRNA A-37 threonylcarbamoyl transferase component Bud32